MQRALPFGMILGLLICHFGETLTVLKADENLERMQAAAKKATDKLEKVKEELARILESAERRELMARELEQRPEPPSAAREKEKGRLKERLEALRSRFEELRGANGSENERVEIREQISKIERELRVSALTGPSRQRPVPAELRPQVEKLEKVNQRIRHIRVAAENLKQAELHDLAHELMEKAEMMERDLQAARQNLAEEFRKSQPRDPETDQVRELKGEIERLRARVKELSQQLESR